MGIAAETFRKQAGVYAGGGIFWISGWSKHGIEAQKGGLK